MPWISSPDPADTADPAGTADGWTSRPWAGGDVFGQPVPLEATRLRVAPGGRTLATPLGRAEALAYVIAGSGTALASPAPGGERFALGPESVLWLSGCDSVTIEAGAGPLDVLLARATPAGPRPRDEGTVPQAAGGFQGHGVRGLAPGTGECPPGPALCKVFTAAELPHLVSTRDTRDRLDLITENVPVGARAIRADRILYHPGDTAAAHYHTDCHHVFCVLSGSGLLYDAEHAHRLEAGDSALVGPGEVHWFENDTGENFSFVEFWAPPPTETIWTVTGDRCTWAPAG